MDEHGALPVVGSRPLLITLATSTVPTTGWGGEPKARARNLITMMKDPRNGGEAPPGLSGVI